MKHRLYRKAIKFGLEGLTIGLFWVLLRVIYITLIDYI